MFCICLEMQFECSWNSPDLLASKSVPYSILWVGSLPHPKETPEETSVLSTQGLTHCTAKSLLGRVMRLWDTIYVFFYSVTLIATQRKKLPPLQTLFCKTASCQLTLLIGFCFFSNYDLLVLPAAQHCVFKAWVYMKFLSKSSPWKGRYVIRSFNTCAFFFFVISCSSQ